MTWIKEQASRRGVKIKWITTGSGAISALEETGWSIARPRRMGAFRRFVYMPEYDLWAEKLCHVYSAHPVRQISEPIEPAHATVFLPAADAIGVLGNDGDRMFLHRYVAAAP